MKLRWLLLSIFGVLILGSPADAGQLLSWEFEENKNRLVFITDEGVQPRAKLIRNPNRLVIELPGTTLGRTTVKETYSGAIRGFRIGQSTDNVVSLVIELAPGYTIDPDRVEFRGASPTEWAVELPSPRVADFPSAERERSTQRTRDLVPPRNDPNPPSRDVESAVTNSNLPGFNLEPAATDNNPPSRNIEPAATDNNSPQLSKSPYVKITSHGFFLDIKGDRTNQVTSTRNGDIIDFDLQGVTLPSDLVSQSVAVNQYGVEEINFSQQDPSTARISLKVAADSSEWRAIFSRIKGLILVPGGTRTVVQNNSPQLTEKQPSPKPIESITINAIDLTDNNSRLSVRSNGNLSANSRLVGNGTYEVTIENAKLGKPFAGPKLGAGSPITQLKVREEASSVILTVTTKLGIRLGNVQSGTNLVALPVIIPARAINVPSPEPPVAARSKPLVVIDPGHGGQDPGTIGIGGVQEKNVILPISLDVAEELRKQGIEVRITRDRDYFISLEGRTDLANDIDADLFVSIHANAINLSRPDVNGLETYYYKSGRRLAEVIHWNILNTVNIRDRNIRRARFFVLRHSEMPAVLLEVGFLTGAEDSSRLKDPSHRRQMAQAIARGIVQYIKENRI
ncbi:N-acetylmuramoyl-L-alanine amidase [Hyella patelloides LEGE 07179]|uniref:N-acetylmuramoyl-L-alanine amidase n=1 Tax=Hyella patelloides LEGE 07179 TaxID=945734 RepID=A0A563VUK4_9CYAN|nr:N-acetylmuramoyl-L-alanine amidase [Hyella patelloides]VEP15120.1 N-acetylmuramoyl-L-alanine amidase [Hyella patelloides LEGE 07179]